MKHSSSMSSIPFPSLKNCRRTLPHSLSLQTFPSALVSDFDASSTLPSSSSSTPSSPTSPKRPSPLRQTSLPEGGDFVSSGPLPRIEESRREETESLWFWRKVLSKNEGLRSSRKNKPVCTSSSVDPLSPSLLDLPVWGTRGEPLPSSASTSPRKGSLPLLAPSSPPPREVRVKEDWEIGIEKRIRRYRGSV